MIPSNIMTRKQRSKWKYLKANVNTSAINDEQLLIIADIYSKLFNRKFILPCRSCGKTWGSWIRSIDAVYDIDVIKPSTTVTVSPD